MFVIIIHMQNRDRLEGPWQVRSEFERKEDAAKFLDGMILGHSAEVAGFNAENGFWWTRSGEVVTRYTITPGAGNRPR